MTHFQEDSPGRRQAFAEHGGARRFFGAALVLGLGLTGISYAWNPPQYLLTDLGTLGGSTSTGYGINARGQVTGTASTAGNVHTHAFRYSRCSMQDLGTLGGSDSTGQGINASGQVTGNSDIKGNATFHAFLYSNGSMQDIDPAGSVSFSSGDGINASGEITGSSNFFAFLYSNGSMNVLYNVGAYSSGNGINGSGEIVGTREVGFSEMPTAAFTYRNGTEQDVPTLGGIYADGAGINARGWITGSSDISFSPPFNQIPTRFYTMAPCCSIWARSAARIATARASMRETRSRALPTSQAIPVLTRSCTATAKCSI